MKSFLQSIKDLIGDDSWSITVKKKGEELTLAIIPKPKNWAEDDEMKPILVTGTPEELEAGLPEILAKAKEKIAGMKVNTDSFDESIKEKEEEDNKPKKIGKGKTKGRAVSDIDLNEQESEKKEEEVKEEKIPEKIQAEITKAEGLIKKKDFMMAKFILKQLKLKNNFKAIDELLARAESLDAKADAKKEIKEIAKATGVPDGKVIVGSIAETETTTAETIEYIEQIQEPVSDETPDVVRLEESPQLSDDENF